MQWNTLEIALHDGRQCTLIPASDYRSSASGDCLPFIRDKNEREQLEQERKDFDQHFRSCWDLRTITGSQALREIQIYVGNALNVAHWKLPQDNDNIECMLREAVKDGQLVPVIHRDRHCALGCVSSPTPAPMRWQTSVGDGGFSRATSWSSYDAGPIFNSEPTLSDPDDPAVKKSRLISAHSAMSGESHGGGSLLGVVETVACIVLGSNGTNAGHADGSDMSALLADAQPFGTHLS